MIMRSVRYREAGIVRGRRITKGYSLRGEKAWLDAKNKLWPVVILIPTGTPEPCLTIRWSAET